MKIVLTLKSRDEEKNIQNVLDSYDWVDQILLADGGSVDRTVEIASKNPKVVVRDFHEKYYRDDGSWRNHEGKHLNFLFQWAEDEKADWIIHEDCDGTINSNLMRDARRILEESVADTVYACRLYVYGKDKHFKKMSFINDQWQTSIWAWRVSLGIRAEEVQRHITINNLDRYTKQEILPPYCLLHNFAPDEETIMRKVNEYKVEAPTAVHPREIYGEPELLPDWAK